jgi:alkanesulfonate monooxygenase SsuD/methylene tetrahydromethanopterin reductase-like flavin-dependent oxidoreductase (luciferase family)
VRAEYGIDTPVEFAVQQQLSVAETDAEARTQMAHFLYASRQVANLRGGTERVERGYSHEIPVEGEPTLDELFESRTLSGSPDTVAEKIRRYQEVCGITQLNCTFSMGSMAPETVIGSMRLFAAAVMPQFR